MNNDFSEDIKLRKTYIPHPACIRSNVQHAPMLHYPACTYVTLPSMQQCSPTQQTPMFRYPAAHVLPYTVGTSITCIPRSSGHAWVSPTQHAPVSPYPACTCLPLPSMHLCSPTQHAPVFPYPACTSVPLPSMHLCSPTQHAPPCAALTPAYEEVKHVFPLRVFVVQHKNLPEIHSLRNSRRHHFNNLRYIRSAI